jgi:hypothetical protein
MIWLGAVMNGRSDFHQESRSKSGNVNQPPTVALGQDAHLVQLKVLSLLNPEEIVDGTAQANDVNHPSWGAMLRIYLDVSKVNMFLRIGLQRVRLS